MLLNFLRQFLIYKNIRSENESQMITMTKRAFPAFVAAFLAIAVMTPLRASATLLSTLISLNQPITVGTLQFSGFSYLATGDMPSDMGINVSSYVDGSGDVGLIFQGAFIDFLGGSGSDALIGFIVTELDAQKQLSRATLSGNPTVLGGSGIASVTETFLPTDTNLSLSIYSSSPGPTRLTDSGTFAVTERTVMVQKDLLTFSASIGGGVPTMSFVTQTFHEINTPIPEPATWTLLGMGLVGFAFKVYRRR